MVALALYAEPITGGAVGFNNIPKHVGTTELLIAVLVQFPQIILWLPSTMSK